MRRMPPEDAAFGRAVSGWARLGSPLVLAAPRELLRWETVTEPIDVFFADIDPVEIELNENWVQRGHTARHLARVRLGLPADADVDSNADDRAVALIVWRDWLTTALRDGDTSTGEPPLEPERRALTNEERRWAHDFVNA